MEKNNFNTIIKEKVLNILRVQDKTIDCLIQNVTKTNVVRSGLIIMSEKSNLHPIIYLDEFFSKIEECSLDQIANEVANLYMNSVVQTDFDMNFLLDYSQVKDNLIVGILNTEKNQSRLETMPHENILNLSMYYFIEIPALSIDDCSASVIVGRDMFDNWNISEEQLKADAWENTRLKYPPNFKSMNSILAETFHLDNCMTENDTTEKINKDLMYVLMGAVYLASDEEMSRIGDYLDEDFIVLPSSRHELIIIPEHLADYDYNTLKEIVHMANEFEVREEDYLSDNVYYYSHKDKKIIIVA